MGKRYIKLNFEGYKSNRIPDKLTGTLESMAKLMLKFHVPISATLKSEEASYFCNKEDKNFSGEFSSEIWGVRLKKSLEVLIPTKISLMLVHTDWVQMQYYKIIVPKL